MKLIKGTTVLITGILSGLYLANIGAGVVGLIPDNIPVVGNIDEFIASLLIMNALAYFGLDLRKSPQAAVTLPTPPEILHPTKSATANRQVS